MAGLPSLTGQDSWLFLTSDSRSSVMDWPGWMADMTSDGRSAVTNWSGWMADMTSDGRSAITDKMDGCV